MRDAGHSASRLSPSQRRAISEAQAHPDGMILADIRTQRALCDKGYAFSTWRQEGDHSYGFGGGFYLYDDLSPEAIAERLLERS